MANGISIDEYLKYLEQQSATNLRPATRSDDSKYVGIPGYVGVIDEVKSDNAALDFLGSLVWGGVHGITWGASEFAAKSKTWEEMNDWERAGWVIGEGLSLFTPIVGPFALLGKGGQVATRALRGNKYIRKAASNLIKEEAIVAKGILEQAKARGVVPESVSRSLERQFAKQLPDAFKNKHSVENLRNLTADVTTARTAQVGLRSQSEGVIKRVLEGSGIPVTDVAARDLAKRFVGELGEGRYVNDIGQWVTRRFGGKNPGRISQYLGMAAQDFLYLGLHALGVEKIESLAHKRSADYADIPMHTTVMSLAFPLIRAIPGGGRESLSRGISSYFQRYKKIDYNKISKMPNGERTTRELLKSNVKGANINIINSSENGQKTWTVFGKPYMGKQDILHQVDNPKDMPLEHVVALLNEMRLNVSQNLVRRWNSNYWGDLIASAPRMGTGVLFMNWEALNMGAFKDMSPQELSAHLFMAALMTKGRGAWDHAGKRGYISDEYGEMHRALNFLQTDHTKMDETISVMKIREMIDKFGIIHGNNPIADEIVNTFDSVFEGERVDWRNNGESISTTKYSKVQELLSSYNAIKKMKDKNFTFITIDEMNSKALDMIQRDLGKVKIGDRSVDEMTKEDLQVELIGETKAEIISDQYDILGLLKERFEIPFSIVPGPEGAPLKGSARMIDTPKGQNTPNIHEYNNLIRNYGSVLNIDIIDDPLLATDLAKGRKMSVRDYDNALGGVIHEAMVDMEGRFLNHNLYLKFDDNIFLKAIKDINATQAKDDLYKVVSHDETKKKNVITLRDELVNLFGQKGKFSNNIYDNEVDKKAGEELLADQKISENLYIIQPVYDLMKNLSFVGKTRSRKLDIKSGDVQEVADKVTDMVKRLPPDWKNNVYAKGLEEFQSRIFTGGNKLSYTAFQRAKDEGLIDFEFEGGMKKIIFPTENSIENALAGVDGATVRTVKEAVQGVYDMFNPQQRGRSHFAPKEHVGSNELLKWIDIHQQVAHSKVKDFVENINDTLGNLGENSMVVKQIVSLRELSDEIQSEIVSPKKTLELDKVRKALAEAKLIHEALKAEKNIDEDTSKKLGGLITALEQGIAEGKEQPSRTFSEENYGKMIESFDEMIQFEMDADHVQKTELSKLLIKLENHLTQKDPNIGYNDAKILLENLTGDFHKLLGNKKSAETPLQELIDEFNNTGNWKDARTVIDAVVKAAGRFNTHQEAYNDIAAKMINDLQAEKLNTERPVNYQELLTKYPSIQDPLDPNAVNNQFVSDISDAFDPAKPNITAKDVFEEYIYSDIRKKYSDSGEQAVKIEQFNDTEAQPLLQNIFGKTLRKIITLDHHLLKFEDKPTRHSLSTITLDRTYTSDPQYKYDYMLLNGSIKIGDRVINMDDAFEIGGDWLIMQNYVDKAITVDMSEMKDLYERLRDVDYVMDIPSIESLKPVKDSNKVYMRLSPMMRIVFPKHEQNINLLNRDFDDIYVQKRTQYGGRGQQKRLAAFEKGFKHLFNSTEQDNEILRLKMMFVHYNRTMSPQFDEMMGKMDQDRGKIEFNSFKRGLISDGGTTTHLTRQALEWSRDYNPNLSVRDKANEILSNGNIKLSVLNDEPANKADDHFFSNKKIIMKQLEEKIISLQNISGGKDTQETKIVNSFVKDITKGTYTSLESFFLDGGKFSGTPFSKLVRSVKGGGDWNGVKTIIMDNDMLGKGFTVYNPEIASVLNDIGIDLLVGKTVAKTLNLDKVQAFNIDPTKSLERGWEVDLIDMDASNFINIPYKNFGISFTTHSDAGVNYSSSMFDFQSPNHLLKAKKLYKIDEIIQKMGTINNNKDFANGDLLRALYKIRQEASGQQLTTGSYTLTEDLLAWGGRESNPLLQASLQRLLQSDFYKILTSRPTQHGEEGISAVDVDNTLSNPVYAQFEGFPNNKTSNSVYQYGGGSITQPMAKTLISRDVEGVADIQDVPFIARDKKTGLDILFSYTDEGKWEYYSPFLKAQEQAKARKGSRIRGLDPDEWIEVDKTHLHNMQKTLEHLHKQTLAMKNVTYSDLIDLLNGRVWKVSENKRLVPGIPIGLTKDFRRLAKDLNIQLGMSVNAIPKVMKDQPLMRIQKVLGSDLNGLATVNSFDLRVTMQRDFDGDHIYKYLKMPMSMLKDYTDDMGDIRDYTPIKDVEYTPGMNMFGFKNGVAGKETSSIGFDKIAHDIAKKDRIVSNVISRKGTLSYLLTSGLKYRGESFVSESFNKKNVELSLSKALDIFQRGGEIFQSTLDKWGPTPKIARTTRDARTDVEDYFIYGLYPSDLGKPSPHHSTESFLRRGFGITSDFEREMFRIMHRTLSKSRAMDNDIHDTAGQRQPTTKELRDARTNINSFFDNPNKYLIRGLLGHARRLRKKGDGEGADKYIENILEFFYTEIPKGSTSYPKIYDALKKGNISPGLTPHFTLDKSLKIKSSMSGHVLDEVIRNPVFYERDNKGRSDKNRTMFSHYNNLRNKLEIIMSFGDVTPEKIDEMVLTDKALPSEIVGGKSVFDANYSGIIRFVANSQHEKAVSSLRLLKNETFKDINKIERAEDRITVTQYVIDALDRQMAKHALLRKDQDLKLVNIKATKDDINWEYRDFKLNGNLYRVKGKIKKDVLDPKKHMGALEYIGSVRDGRKERVRRGYTYIVDKRPPKFVTVEDPEVRWNRAFARATGVGTLKSGDVGPEYNPDVNPIGATSFFSAVEALRRGVANTYSKAHDAADKQPIDKNDIYYYNSVITDRLIGEFFRDYGRSGNFEKLLRYLLQPQIQRNVYIKEGAEEIPYFKMNTHLIESVFHWMRRPAIGAEPSNAEKFGFDPRTSIETIIKDMNASHDHKTGQIELVTQQYNRMRMEGREDWNRLRMSTGDILMSDWYVNPVLSNYARSFILGRGDFSRRRDINGKQSYFYDYRKSGRIDKIMEKIMGCK